MNGCPVCKDLCCCNSKSVYCHRKNHCYRKCPASKRKPVEKLGDAVTSAGTGVTSTNTDIPKTYGIFDILAAVADMSDKISAVPVVAVAPGSYQENGSGGHQTKTIQIQPTAEFLQRINVLYPVSSNVQPPFGWAEPPHKLPGSGGLSSLLLLGPVPSSSNMGGATTTARRCEDAGVDGYTFNRSSSLGIRLSSDLGTDVSQRGGESTSSAHLTFRSNEDAQRSKAKRSETESPSHSLVSNAELPTTRSPKSTRKSSTKLSNSSVAPPPIRSSQAIDLLALVSSYSSAMGPA